MKGRCSFEHTCLFSHFYALAHSSTQVMPLFGKQKKPFGGVAPTPLVKPSLPPFSSFCQPHPAAVAASNFSGTKDTPTKPVATMQVGM
jgi:hypothetical protein